jgi:hypothetical protein
MAFKISGKRMQPSQPSKLIFLNKIKYKIKNELNQIINYIVVIIILINN